MSVCEFFKSWGMFPTNEDTGNLNYHNISQGINRKCYEKMYAEACNLYGKAFAEFYNKQVQSMDDMFYLVADTWNDVEQAYKQNT